MTEKKPQSTVQPEQAEGFNSLAEDELDLIDLLKFLARKKVFILAVTSVFTLFSIFYAQSITPVYRATIGLLNHKENFSPISVLEQLGLDKVKDQTIKPLNIFERFLLNIKSYEFKKEVFVNGGFQKKISRKTGVDTDQSVSAIYNSTKIVKRDGNTYLELEGSQPKVMLEFLTALVEAAKENVNTEIKDKARSFIRTRINNLSAKIEELHQKITVQKQIENRKITLQKQIENQKITLKKQIEKEKKAEKKAKEIGRLSKALDMAKRMGIKNNNFDKPDNGSAPVWFRYGELALQQEMRSLRSTKEETPNTKKLPIEKEKLKLKKLQQGIKSLRSKEKATSKTKNLSIEKAKLKKFQTADLTLLKFKVVTIGKYDYFLVKPNQTFKIIAFGVAFGLFISIFIAFLVELKQLRAKEIASIST